jgi:4-alpha-glucanotransferase
MRHSRDMPFDRRRAGILAHPTSLPTRFGIGDIGPVSHEFLEWLSSAGQSVWQLLPLGPSGFGNSPYAPQSAFAGEPLLISPESLVEEGLLAAEDLVKFEMEPSSQIDFDAVRAARKEAITLAYRRYLEKRPRKIDVAFERFRNDEFHQKWLTDWALYISIKQENGGRAWNDWEPDLARRDEGALDDAWTRLHDEIEREIFAQFLFFRQWSALRKKASSLGITIVADMPIYVAYDSADTWSHQSLFQLDENGRPTSVAGVPPDYFSTTGQLWGNPLYRWEKMREDGFCWWIERIKLNLLLADLVRIDHFRAFAGYWSVPVNEKTAIHGEWIQGPGIELFEKLRESFGGLPLIAEDLGLITPDVIELRDRAGLPGMRVLQFGFGDDASEHAPHRFVEQSVVYTGTHDNDTTRGWFHASPDHERERARAYLGENESIEWAMIRAAYTSVARFAIVPLQDVFGLGSEARMNTPGEAKNNWAWRATSQQFTNADVARLRRLSQVTGRN